MAATKTIPEAVDEVRAAWAEALEAEVDVIPLDTTFFDMGGNSLLLLLVWERLNELTSRDLHAADLFEHNTVRAQANLVAGTGRRP